PADTVNVAYNQTITGSGGNGALTLQVSNVQNAIPGLTVPASGTNTLASGGTPTASGTETFTVTAIDAAGASGSASYSITVNPVVSFVPGTLAQDTVAIGYNQTITTT